MNILLSYVPFSHYFINPTNNEEETATVDTSLHTLIIEKELEHFKLPIDYLDGSHLFLLNPALSSDIELIGKEKEEKGMYDYLLRPSSPFGSTILKKYAKRYTTHTPFLEDTQAILKDYSINKDISLKEEEENDYDIPTLIELWKHLKHDPAFLDTYSFVDWEILKYLNQSSLFLLIITTINFLSPVMSLLFPFFLLLFPFLLLKIQGLDITVETYIEVLKSIGRNHFIGKSLVMGLEGGGELQWDKVAYFLITVVLYAFQIYQNINACFRFHKNTQYVNSSLLQVKGLLRASLGKMEGFSRRVEGRATYAPFIETMKVHREVLENLKEELEIIEVMNMKDLQQYQQLGVMLKVLYRLHNDPATEEALKYAMGFMGYMETIEGVAENIERGHVGYCKFYKGKKSDKNDKKKMKKGDYTHFQQQYYPPLLEDIEQGGEPIRNDTSLEKNIILSAPNKAGKTTLLKTTLMNVVFSQQFGVGFYDTARLEPYAHLHSYLNIPDTSGRDSLFQAESRRCKEIIDCIRDTAIENPEQKHFCIFDELYSGTNPEEATQAGKAFLSYLGKCRGVDFLLTTHYIDICKHFYKENKEEEDDKKKKKKKKTKNKEIENYLMEVLVSPETGAFHYTYKMKRGISTIKGGIRVLQDMDYPQSILEEIRGNAFKIK